MSEGKLLNKVELEQIRFDHTSGTGICTMNNKVKLEGAESAEKLLELAVKELKRQEALGVRK